MTIMTTNMKRHDWNGHLFGLWRDLNEHCETGLHEVSLNELRVSLPLNVPQQDILQLLLEALPHEDLLSEQQHSQLVHRSLVLTITVRLVL